MILVSPEIYPGTEGRAPEAVEIAHEYIAATNEAQAGASPVEDDDPSAPTEAELMDVIPPADEPASPPVLPETPDHSPGQGAVDSEESLGNLTVRGVLTPSNPGESSPEGGSSLGDANTSTHLGQDGSTDNGAQVDGLPSASSASPSDSSSSAGSGGAEQSAEPSSGLPIEADSLSGESGSATVAAGTPEDRLPSVEDDATATDLEVDGQVSDGTEQADGALGDTMEHGPEHQGSIRDLLTPAEPAAETGAKPADTGVGDTHDSRQPSDAAEEFSVGDDLALSEDDVNREGLGSATVADGGEGDAIEPSPTGPSQTGSSESENGTSVRDLLRPHSGDNALSDEPIVADDGLPPSSEPVLRMPSNPFNASPSTSGDPTGSSGESIDDVVIAPQVPTTDDFEAALDVAEQEATHQAEEEVNVGEQVISVARDEVARGLTSSDSRVIDEYSLGEEEDWCANFVSWVYREAGHAFEPFIISENHPWGERHGRPAYVRGDWQIPSTMDMYDYFVQGVNGAEFYDVGDDDPQPGDVVFYFGSLTPDPSNRRHVAIVESYDPTTGTMITIGGNESGGQLQRAERDVSFGAMGLLGFGRKT